MDVAEVGGRTMQSERRVERTGPAHQSPEDQLYELLIRLIRELARLEPNRPEGGDPLSLSERFALSVLAESQPLTQSEVAERLGLEKSTVSRLVARLEREELITRERKVGNRRLYQITLTASGRAAAGQVAQEMRRRHERIVRGLAPGERDALVTGLDAFLRNAHDHHDSLDEHEHGDHALH